MVLDLRPEGLRAGAGRTLPGARRDDREGRRVGLAHLGGERRGDDGLGAEAGRPGLDRGGAFSHRIARTIGERIPLETERGYNTTLPGDAFDLRTQITFVGHGFVVSRPSDAVRIGGAVELGGLELPPNFRRSEAMMVKAQSFLPGVKNEGGRPWMGFCP